MKGVSGSNRKMLKMPNDRTGTRRLPPSVPVIWVADITTRPMFPNRITGTGARKRNWRIQVHVGRRPDQLCSCSKGWYRRILGGEGEFSATERRYVLANEVGALDPYPDSPALSGVVSVASSDPSSSSSASARAGSLSVWGLDSCSLSRLDTS